MDPLGEIQFQFLRIPMWTLPFAQMGGEGVFYIMKHALPCGYDVAIVPWLFERTMFAFRKGVTVWYITPRCWLL